MHQTDEPTHPVVEAFSAIGLDDLIGGPEALRAGVQELEAELLRVATDAYIAQTRGEKLSDAAVDFERYPMLAVFHQSVDDLLLMTLPPELVRWMEHVLRAPDLALFEGLSRRLVALAAHDDNPVRRAMFRVLLFEWLRLSLMILYFIDAAPSEVGVLPEHLSEIVEEKIDVWLADPPGLEDGERPLHILFAASVAGLDQFMEELKDVIGAMQADFVEELRWRARLEKELASFDRRDALLVRNAMASGLEERPLSVEHLQARHPLVLRDVARNTLDQRLKRFRRTLVTGSSLALRRRDKALIDIVAEQRNRTDRRSSC
jgi:hypothetical protein